MSKILIELKDTKNRKLPIVFKHVRKEVSEGGGKEYNYVQTRESKGSRLEYINYYKPISKNM